MASMDHLTKTFIMAMMEEGKEQPLAAWLKIEAKLMDVGLAWKAWLPPDAFLIHPSNRSGSLLNPYDIHKKGAFLLQVGLDPSALQGSTAFELSPKPDKRHEQVQFTKKHVASSKYFPDVNGKERYLTVSSSHTTCFLKAVLAVTPQNQSFRTNITSLKPTGCVLGMPI